MSLCFCACRDICAPFSSCSPTALAHIPPVGRTVQMEDGEDGEDFPFSLHTVALLLGQGGLVLRRAWRGRRVGGKCREAGFLVVAAPEMFLQLLFSFSVCLFNV